MTKHFYILQTNERAEININSSVIEKIYKIIDEDNKLGNLLDSTSAFYGKINTNYTYREYIDTINERFPSITYLEILCDGIYISFKDKNVEQILINNFSDLPGVLETLQVDISQGFYKNGVRVFQGNDNIETFDELGQLKNIKLLGSTEFDNCDKLKSIDLSNITTLSYKSLAFCPSLEIDVNMPKLAVTGQEAFRNSGILSISNIGLLTATSTGMFGWCSKLVSINNNCFDNITELGDSTFNTCPLLEDVGTLSSLRIIGDSALQGCSSLTSFQFNENITQIKQRAFNNDILLTIENLNLPNLVTLGSYAFTKTRIKKVTSLGNITQIPGYCFDNCSLLTEIALPNAITNIGAYAFSHCENLIIDDLNLPNLTNLGNGAFQYSGIKRISNIGSISSLNGFVFDHCLSLTYADLTGVTNSGDTTFSGCSSLTTVISPNLQILPAYSFYNCTSLSSIDLSNVTMCDRYALSNCSSLTGEIDLHNLEYIGRQGMAYIPNFKIKDGNLTNITHIDFISFENYALNYGDPSTTFVDLGSKLTSNHGSSFVRAKTNLIYRYENEIPEDILSLTMSIASGFYVYITDDLVNIAKERFSSEASRIKSISELPAEWQ